MSAWLAYPILALLVAAQTSLVPQFDVAGALPELVLCWVITWAVIRGRGEALPWAVFAGLLLDLLSRNPMGAHLLALVLVAFLADLGHRVMHGSTALFTVSATLLGSLIYGAILLLVARPGGGGGELSYLFLTQVVPGALYNLVAVLPIFLVLRSLDRRFPLSVLPEW